MSAFEYMIPEIRPELALENRAIWEGLSRPGNWWTGEQRVAIAAEVRHARKCALCRDRRAALSPESVQGEHDCLDSTRILGEATTFAMDAIHRIVNDAGRLSRSWYERRVGGAFSDGQYVELLGVVVAVISIDSFHCGLGQPLEPLPTPQEGTPSGYRPAGLEHDTAWVAMIANGKTAEPEADLFPGSRTANVVRAMSLVPDAVRTLLTLSAAQYVPMWAVAEPTWSEGRALDRSQIELLAGRVSALNECFY